MSCGRGRLELPSHCLLGRHSDSGHAPLCDVVVLRGKLTRVTSSMAYADKINSKVECVNN